MTNVKNKLILMILLIHNENKDNGSQQQDTNGTNNGTCRKQDEKVGTEK